MWAALYPNSTAKGDLTFGVFRCAEDGYDRNERGYRRIGMGSLRAAPTTVTTLLGYVFAL